MRKYFFISLGILVIVGVGVLIYFGVYPEVSINGEYISKYSINTNVKIASALYRRVEDKMDVRLNEDELRVDVATQLIENKLIDKELYSKDPTDMEKLVWERISQVSGNKFNSAAKELYGVGAKDSALLILYPQAKKDVLKNRFTLEGKDFDEWLIEAKKTAKVKFYFSGLKWNGSEVSSR